MKLVFFITSLGSGGAERVVSILSNELAARGHDVHIGIITNRNVCYEIADKVTIHYLDCEKDLRLPAWQRYPRRVTKIRNLVKDISPDIAISFMAETNIEVCLALTGLKVPLIVSERNDPAIDPKSFKKQLMRRVLYRKPVGFVFQTPDARAYFSHSIQQKSLIILNPLSENLPEYEYHTELKRIVSVCRLNRQKNIPLLLDAFKKFVERFPEYTLDIYGEGNLEEEIRTRIECMNLQNQVVLKGFCAKVHHEIKDATMFVMSSDYEGMPNALLEAMAIGLPCISTNCPCGGPRMLISHGENGLLVPVNGVDELYNAMCYLAENPQIRLRMGKQAQYVKEEANSQVVVDKWEAYINNCVQ